MPVVRTFRKLGLTRSKPKDTKRTLGYASGPSSQSPVRISATGKNGDFQDPFQCRNSECYTRPFANDKGLKSHLQRNPPCMEAFMKSIAMDVSQPDDNIGIGLGSEEGNVANRDWQEVDMDEGPMFWDGNEFDWEEEFNRQHAKLNVTGNQSQAGTPFHPIGDSNSEISYHPNTPRRGEKGVDLFESIEQGEDSSFRKDNPYHPFGNRGDYQLGSWLTRNNLPMKSVDEFFTLEWVRSTSKKNSSSGSKQLETLTIR